MSETICEECGKPRRPQGAIEPAAWNGWVSAYTWPSSDTRAICTCLPADNTLSYVTEVAPFTLADWDRVVRMVNRMKTKVVIDSKLQLTEHGKQVAQQLLEQYTRQETPDTIHAEYTDGNGVKYAGTLCQVVPKEQDGTI